MLKMIMGAAFSYLMFNENGRKISNQLGNKIMEITKKGVDKIGTSNKESTINDRTDSE